MFIFCIVCPLVNHIILPDLTTEQGDDSFRMRNEAKQNVCWLYLPKLSEDAEDESEIEEMEQEEPMDVGESSNSLQPLVLDEGQLVAIVAEPAQDPAPEAPSPTPAQKLVELPGPPLHINSST